MKRHRSCELRGLWTTNLPLTEMKPIPAPTKVLCPASLAAGQFVVLGDFNALLLKSLNMGIMTLKYSLCFERIF
jgi:hypothetical protein